MSYWHKLEVDGWECSECGSRQHGEYHCEVCAEIERETEKKVRRLFLKAAVAAMGSLSPQQRRNWLEYQLER